MTANPDPKYNAWAAPTDPWDRVLAAACTAKLIAFEGCQQCR